MTTCWGRKACQNPQRRCDDLIEAAVAAVSKLLPNAMLHWEDFGATNARRILIKYADQVCTFNANMQGTTATVLGGRVLCVRAPGCDPAAVLRHASADRTQVHLASNNKSTN